MRIFVASALEQQNAIGMDILTRLHFTLETRHGEGSTFIAAALYPTPDANLSPYESYDMIKAGLRTTDAFILYFPQRVFSGALIELGMALAFEKPCLILTQSENDLPYMIREGGHNISIELLNYKHDHDEVFMLISKFIESNVRTS